MDDEWDDELHDCEPVDLDGDGYGGEATGDRQLDVGVGYQSPRDRRNLTGFEAHPPNLDWIERNKRDREARRAKRAVDARQRADERRARTTPAPEHPAQGPDHPDLEPHMAQAVAEGMPGRDLGWWRVDVDATGRAVWTKVDAPDGSAPTMTVEQTPAPRRRWWQRRRPEQVEGSPGTVIW